MRCRQEFIFICLRNFHANIQFDSLIYRFSSAPNAGDDTPPAPIADTQQKTIFTSKRRVMINIPGLGLQML
jgi:hypothetical protein